MKKSSIITSFFTGATVAQNLTPKAPPSSLFSPQPSVQIVAPPQLIFFQSLQQLIGNAVIIVFIIASFLVFAMLIYGAIEWIISGGDKDKVANARKRIIAALIGLAILALSYLIISVVGNIIGFNPLQGFKLPSPG